MDMGMEVMVMVMGVLGTQEEAVVVQVEPLMQIPQQEIMDYLTV
jgi:hypothetical protein